MGSVFVAKNKCGIIEGTMAGDEKQLTVSEKKANLKEARARKLAANIRIVRFCYGVFIRVNDRWQRFTDNVFSEQCYKMFGAGISKSQISDLDHLFRSAADDVTHLSRYLALPDGRVYDMEELEFTDQIPHEDVIFSTTVNPTNGDSHKKWLLEVANGDEGVARDILYTLAPIFMHKKPHGVVWYLGSGANGKSTVLNVIYNIVDNAFLTEMSVKSIEDERDSLDLNGMMANVCRESSEGHLDDSGSYKRLGDHNHFKVHKFNSQDRAWVNGNVHHIFNANNIPTFSDKSSGVRRRTFVVPFNAKFKQDPTYEERLFTQEFLGDMLGAILEAGKAVQGQDFSDILSETTQIVKNKYDQETNTAETYVKELLDSGIYAFNNFTNLETDYTNWCDEGGHARLGRKTLVRVIDEMGFVRKTVRIDGKTYKRYIVEGKRFDDLILVGGIRVGMYRSANSEIELPETEHNDLDNLMELL